LCLYKADVWGQVSYDFGRLLRKEFNRAGKTEGGICGQYRFDPDDPIVKQIIDRAKAKLAKKGDENR
jgi:hypothetical protein